MKARVTFVGLAAAAASVLSAGTAQAAPTACPNTFQVLHNDRIGALSVPAGAYRLTVLKASALSCAAASDRFRAFLEDFDGKLPAPWRLKASTGTFTGARGAGFSIAATSTPSGGGGGRHPATGLRCAGTFRVLHNDRIGSFQIPKGAYTVTLLSSQGLSCSQASSQFAAFLQDFDGRLPAPWLLDKQTGTFERGSARVGFRIEPAVGPPSPSGGGGGGGGINEGRRCPGTFRVEHNDRIGALALPAGPYRITLGKSEPITCAASSQAFARFLDLPNGNLPKGWRLNTRTGTFSRNGVKAFRVKPVR